MKIPKKLIALGHTYSISTKSVKNEATGNEAWGRTHHGTHSIYLDGSLKGSRLEETFLHEVIHIAFERANLQQDFDNKQEEKIVNGLANACLLYTSPSPRD